MKSYKTQNYKTHSRVHRSCLDLLVCILRHCYFCCNSTNLHSKLVYSVRYMYMYLEVIFRGFIKFLCRRSVGFFMRAFLVFLLKESTERRRKQPGKLMAKSHSQPVNLPGAQPFMNPLYVLVYHFLFSPHFDVICDLLLSRPMAT